MIKCFLRSRHDRKAFLAVTGHWVDQDMRLCCHTLKATALEVVCWDKWEVPRETACNVLQFLDQTLEEYGVKQFSITTDAPSVMESVRASLDNGLRCICHVLHCAIGKALALPCVQSPLDKLRKVCVHVKQSCVLTEALFRERKKTWVAPS